jgi:hypothetical protein
MKTPIAISLIALGALLLVLSGVWTSIFSGESRWTSEKAARSAKVKERLYNLAFVLNAPGGPSMQKGQDLGVMKAEYEQLKKENDELNAEFKSASEGPKTTSGYLKWSGIAFALVGVVGWYAVNQSR